MALSTLLSALLFPPIQPGICTAHWLPLTAVAWNVFCASMAAGLLLRTAYDAAHPLVIGDFAEDGRHAAQWLAILSCAITAFALTILAIDTPQPGSAIFLLMLQLMPISMSLAAIVLIIRYVIRLAFQPAPAAGQGPDGVSMDQGLLLQLGSLIGLAPGGFARPAQTVGLSWRPNVRPFARANGLAVLIGIAMLLPTLWSLQLPRVCQ